MTDPNPRRLQIKWWHLAIATAVLLIATAYAWRAIGHRQYLAVVEQLHAAGKPASVDDFVALAPPVDHEVQDDWDAWQKLRNTTAKSDFHAEKSKHQKTWDAWLVGQGPRPIHIDDLIAKHAPDHAEALPLLRSGKLVLGSFGWIRQDLPPDKRQWPETVNVRSSSLLALRELSMWLHHAAVLADDPRQHLSDFDALVMAMGRPATLLDAMLSVAFANFRDRTYLELALRGRLPDDARLRWLSEPAHNLRLIADGLEGDCALMYGHAVAARLKFDPTPLSIGNRNWRSIRDNALTWLSGYQDCAVIIGTISHATQRLRGERADMWPSGNQIEARLGPLGKTLFNKDSVASLFGSVPAAVQADASHRIYRLGVRVIGFARMGALPKDQPTLLTALGDPLALTPHGDALHLRYEMPTSDRFRLVIDPASPVPNFDDPTRMPQRSKAAGSEPAKEMLVLPGFGGSGGINGTLEIQLSPTP